MRAQTILDVLIVIGAVMFICWSDTMQARLLFYGCRTFYTTSAVFGTLGLICESQYWEVVRR